MTTNTAVALVTGASGAIGAALAGPGHLLHQLRSPHRPFSPPFLLIYLRTRRLRLLSRALYLEANAHSQQNETALQAVAAMRDANRENHSDAALNQQSCRWRG